ncbi:hypothetical protein FSPOR_10003 [Fusarium sporotrichioides]|uniref:RRM domain-containing protein n=1 Tax=Fusarium sporotrichioides TaxID=5514 RepID=A0A395RN10_FUSSP|nr:hypothetical protein FSPOR_10003 [Fusarium sporotrichioides]
MASPSTPDSHKSSSSPAASDITPSPTQQNTPFTEMGTHTNPRFNKTIDYSKLFTESNGARQDQIPAVPLSYAPAQHTSPPSELGLNPSFFYKRKGDLGNTFTTRSSSNNFTIKPCADVLAQAQPQLQTQYPMAMNHMVAHPPVPANPVRQPAIPPVDHASPVRDSFAGSLAPSPAIWEGLKGQFSQFNLGEHQAPTSAPRQATLSSDQEVRAFKLPSYLSSYTTRQAFLSSTTSVPTHPQPDSPTLRQPSGTPRGFRPMAAINHNRTAIGSENGREEPEVNIFSDNYKGEHTMRNASAMDLSPEENCALWLTNLPPDVTHNQLLAQIRNIGRIWCTVINEPDYDRHDTAAAKVVFFTPHPAQLLLSKSLTQGLEVSGYPVRVTHNRVKYGEQPMVGAASRVLIITGKSTFVNPESLTEFFKERFVFEIDEITPLIVQPERVKGGRSVVEYRFGSFRCQAQMGKMALEKDRPQGFEKVEFGEDPCEVGETLSAYGIAAERIQGKGM